MDKLGQLLERERRERLDSIVPGYFGVVHQMNLSEIVYHTRQRTIAVDIAYRTTHIMGMNNTTAFAAARLFDRYASTPGSLADITSRPVMLMMCCVFLTGKIVDSDHPRCTIPYMFKLYKCYAMSETEDYELFRASFVALELKILKALNYDVTALPIPAEYVTLDSNWFNHMDCSQMHGYYRPTDVVRGREFSFLCDCFVHSYQSTFYKSSEIAAAVFFCCTNEERKIANKVPVPNCMLTVTPAMKALWDTVSWSRGIELSHAIADVSGMVFNLSAGLQRVHEWKYMKQLKK